MKPDLLQHIDYEPAILWAIPHLLVQINEEQLAAVFTRILCVTSLSSLKYASVTNFFHSYKSNETVT